MKATPTERPYLIHLLYPRGVDEVPPEACWSDPPKKLHFGNGAVEIMGIADNLSPMVDYLSQKKPCAEVIGPMELKKQLQQVPGRVQEAPAAFHSPDAKAC